MMFKADTHEGFCSRSRLQAHFARVSTHEGGLFAPGACSQIFNWLNIVEHFVGWKICSQGWSIPMKSLVHTEEHALGACSRSKIPCVYWPLVPVALQSFTFCFMQRITLFSPNSVCLVSYKHLIIQLFFFYCNIKRAHHLLYQIKSAATLHPHWIKWRGARNQGPKWPLI